MIEMDLIKEIERLKQEHQSVILAHNYQPPEIQDIADFTGDSLGLSIQASRTDAQTVVFCGVYFMAETAKILSPTKTVIIPEREAGCPMADMITVEQLREMKRRYPGARVLSYVNTTADIKAESDVCCTSANAVEILNNMFDEDEQVLFVPDKYLAAYAAACSNRKVIPWRGYCPSHARILPEDIVRRKQEHPDAKVLAHPECNGNVLALADEVLSTSGMLRYARDSETQDFIIATEAGMLYPLKKENPNKNFYPASDLAVCHNMKKVTLQKLYLALKDEGPTVTLPGETIRRAQKSLTAMVGQTNLTSPVFT